MRVPGALLLLGVAGLLLAGCGDEGLNTELNLVSITVDGTPFTDADGPIDAVAGETVGLRVNVVDPQGGDIFYDWDVPVGTLTASTDDSTDWNLPNPLAPGVYRATVLVTDEDGDQLDAHAEIRIT